MCCTFLIAIISIYDPVRSIIRRAEEYNTGATTQITVDNSNDTDLSDQIPLQCHIT